MMPSDTMEILLSIRVTRGARLLDQQYPDWRKLIDIEKLNMRSVKRCIVGQLLLDLPHELYTDYEDACKSHLGLYTREEREKHGFELENSRIREYPLLDKAWILEIGG